MKKLLMLLLAAMLAIGLAACGSEEETDASSDDNTETEDTTEDATEEEEDTPSDEDTETEDTTEDTAEEEEETNELLTVGDTAEVDGVEFTLVNVTTTDERNEFADTDPSNVVEIEYEIVNNTEDEISVGMDLDVYDGAGSQTETYPLDSTMGSLQPGKNIQGFGYFGVEEGPIEIYFAPIVSFEDPAIFEAEID